MSVTTRCAGAAAGYSIAIRSNHQNQRGDLFVFPINEYAPRPHAEPRIVAVYYQLEVPMSSLLMVTIAGNFFAVFGGMIGTNGVVWPALAPWRGRNFRRALTR